MSLLCILLENPSSILQLLQIPKRSFLVDKAVGNESLCEYLDGFNTHSGILVCRKTWGNTSCLPASIQGSTCMNVASVDQRTRSNPTWRVISVHTSSQHILTTLGQPFWLHPTSQVFTTPTKIPSSLRSPSNCSRAGRGEFTLWHVDTVHLSRCVLHKVAYSDKTEIQLLSIQINCCKYKLYRLHSVVYKILDYLYYNRQRNTF
jgi:hypothetical protein